jgi:hypothetical protein
MSAYEEILDFITSSPALEQIVNFDLSSEAQKRIAHLEAQEEDGQLSKDEQDELREFRRAADFMHQLMLRAQRRLGDDHE